MNKYAKEIIFSVFLVFFVYLTFISAGKSFISWDLFALTYILSMVLWAFYKKYSEVFLNYLAIVFFLIMLIADLIGDRTLTNNTAVLIFMLITFSLIYRLTIYAIKKKQK